MGRVGTYIELPFLEPQDLMEANGQTQAPAIMSVGNNVIPTEEESTCFNTVEKTSISPV
jgi:hypothetical protein